MELQHFEEDQRGFFKASEEGKEAGRMTYSWASDDGVIIDHTEVNPEFKGRA